MPITGLQFNNLKRRIDLATGSDLDCVGAFYGVARLKGDNVQEGDIGYRLRIIAKFSDDFEVDQDRYEPEPGDHFAKEGEGVSCRVYRAISVGERMIFAEDIHEGEETLCDKLAPWVKVDDNGEMIRHARIMSVFHQVIDGDLPDAAGAQRIRAFVREIEELAEERAQREAQPTPEQAIAIGRNVHLAIENAMDAIQRPKNICNRQWNEIYREFIGSAQAAFNEFEDKENGNDCPF